MKTLLVLLLLTSGCSLYLSGQETRLTRIEAAIDSKADAGRVDQALRQLLEKIQTNAADVAAMKEQKK